MNETKNKKTICVVEKPQGKLHIYYNEEKKPEYLSFDFAEETGTFSGITDDGKIYIDPIYIDGTKIRGFLLEGKEKQKVQYYFKNLEEQKKKEEEKERKKAEKKGLVYQVKHFQTFQCDESQEVFALMPIDEGDIYMSVHRKKRDEITNLNLKMSNEYWRVPSSTKGFVEINGKKLYEGDTISYEELKKLAKPQEEEKQKQEEQEKRKQAEKEKIMSQMKIMKKEQVKTSAFSGMKAKIQYDNVEYIVKQGGFDNSFGEGDIEDNYIPVMRVEPKPKVSENLFFQKIRSSQ